MNSQELAQTISKLILEKKGEDVVILDLRGVTTMTDFFVICSVSVDVQAKAIMEHIKEQLIFQSIKAWHREGTSSNSWILLDYVDVVVHIFKKEARQFYALEHLWGDAILTEIKDTHGSSGIH